MGDIFFSTSFVLVLSPMSGNLFDKCLVPEAVADDPDPGPLLVPLDAVVVPAQHRVHLAAQGHRLAFPVSSVMVSNKKQLGKNVINWLHNSFRLFV